MNKQINPDHCYQTDDGVLYLLAPAVRWTAHATRPAEARS